MQHSPQMVLELAGFGALDRPVTAVVHARRDLVGEQPAIEVEEFDAADADVVERVEQRNDAGFGCLLERVVVAARRGTRHPQDAASMFVFDRRPATDLAVVAPHGDDRALACEGYERLEDQRDAAEVVPRAVGRGRVVQDRLALPVVAAAPRLEDGRSAERTDCRVEVGAAVDSPERRGPDPESGAGFLLGQPVLGDLERRGRREDGRDRAQGACRRGRHAFPFVGDDRGAGRRPPCGVEIVERAVDNAAGDTGSRLGSRIEKTECQPHRQARKAEHPPELTAAQHRHLRHCGPRYRAPPPAVGRPRSTVVANAVALSPDLGLTLQRERDDLGVGERVFRAPQRLDLVERALQRAVARRHQECVLLRDAVETLLHLIERHDVLLPLA